MLTLSIHLAIGQNVSADDIHGEKNDFPKSRERSPQHPHPDQTIDLLALACRSDVDTGGAARTYSACRAYRHRIVETGATDHPFHLPSPLIISRGRVITLSSNRRCAESLFHSAAATLRSPFPAWYHGSSMCFRAQARLGAPETQNPLWARRSNVCSA